MLKLKEYGKYVIGVGMQKSSSDILVQNCDEYYSYTSIAGLQRTSDLERVKRDPWNLVTDAITKMMQRGDVMRSDRLKQVMREFDPGFSEGDIGFSKFSKFLSAAQKRGLVDLTKSEAGQFEISLPGQSRAASSGNGRRAPAPAARHPKETAAPQRKRRKPVKDRRAGGARTPQATAPSSQQAKPDQGTGTTPKRPAVAAPTKPASKPAGRTAGRATQGVSKHGAANLVTPPSKPPPQTLVEEIGPKPSDPPSSKDGKATDSPPRGGSTRRRGRSSPLSLFGKRASSRTRSKQSGKGASTDASERAATGKPAGPTRSAAAKVANKEHSQTERTAGASATASASPSGPAPKAEAKAEPKNGKRLEDERFDARKLRLPTDPDAMRRYLANRYRGVGDKTAEVLVDRFGTDLFRVLLEEPKSIKGVIPPRRAEQLLEAWDSDYKRRRASHR